MYPERRKRRTGRASNPIFFWMFAPLFPSENVLFSFVFELDRYIPLNIYMWQCCLIFAKVFGVFKVANFIYRR